MDSEFQANSTTRNDDSFSPTADCFYHRTSNLNGRFYLVLIFGSSLCVVAFFENLFLAYLLTTRTAFRRSPLFYLAVLAVFDVFLSPSWILVQAVPILYDYIESPQLYYAWIWYSPTLYAVSVAVLTASAYLIIFASFETYLKILRRSSGLLNFSASHRTLAAVGAWILGAVLQISHLWEIQVIPKKNCTGFEAYVIHRTALFENEFFNTLITFYVRNIFDVFVPFFVLLYMNSGIMIMIKRRSGRRYDSTVNNPTNVKDATRELISDVIEYLISNILNVILAFWETFAFEDLVTNRMDFYDYSSDTVNILTVFCRTVRLPVYCFCNQEIKYETISFVKRISKCFFCKNKAGHRCRSELDEIHLTEQTGSAALLRKSYSDCTDSSRGGPNEPLHRRGFSATTSFNGEVNKNLSFSDFSGSITGEENGVGT